MKKNHASRKKHVAENARKFEAELKRREKKAQLRKLRYAKSENE
jgi:hypothetical protein